MSQQTFMHFLTVMSMCKKHPICWRMASLMLALHWQHECRDSLFTRLQSDSACQEDFQTNLLFRWNRPMLAYHDWQTLLVFIKCVQKINMEKHQQTILTCIVQPNLVLPYGAMGAIGAYGWLGLLLPNQELPHRACLSLVFRCVSCFFGF